MPDTLVHGDFHLGNWRSDGTRTVVVDYADSLFGHPAMDGLRPRRFVDEERWTLIAQVWARAWQEHVPGSAPEPQGRRQTQVNVPPSPAAAGPLRGCQLSEGRVAGVSP
ncbi:MULTISPECIES: phosphotransferase [unclassified Streptomyces]|uniref:phosphotransferase n=1 Tax=unclassified Streptomyces TaxID=2593676 RepID=UPI003652649A